MSQKGAMTIPKTRATGYRLFTTFCASDAPFRFILRRSPAVKLGRPLLRSYLKDPFFGSIWLATYDRLQVTGVLWPGSAHNRIIPKVSLRMIINHQKPKHFLRGLPVRLLPVTVDCQALNSQPSASPGTPVAANRTETHEFLQVVSI